MTAKQRAKIYRRAAQHLHNYYNFGIPEYLREMMNHFNAPELNLFNPMIGLRWGWLLMLDYEARILALLFAEQMALDPGKRE